MEFRYICEFVDLVETGKFSESAEQLFISQSSLSKHMKTLEMDLGVPLFERATKRKVKLNQYGELFLPYARQLKQTYEDYLKAQQQQLRDISGSLTVGSIPVMSQYGITDVLTGFQMANPSIRLNLKEVESDTAKDLLRQRELDLAIVREHGDQTEEFSRLPFTVDHMVAVLPEDHPLAGQESVPLADLRNERFVLLQDVSYMHELCIAECHKAGFEPMVVFNCSHAASIVDLVQKGVGVSLLTKKPVSMLKLEGVVLVDIAPEIVTNINLIYRKESAPSVPINLFLSFFRSYMNPNGHATK